MSATDPYEWVRVYAANMRNLGAQMGRAVRKLETSWKGKGTA